MGSLHEISTAVSEEFHLQDVKEYLHQADPGKIKSLNAKLNELVKLLPIGRPQLEQSDRVPKFLTKQSVAEDESQQGHMAQTEQFEVLSAELQQYEAIYQLQSKIIGVLSTHQLNLSGAIEKYRQQVLGKIESSLIQEGNTNPVQQGQDEDGEANLGKRSAVRWLKEVAVRSEGNKGPKSEKGVQVCTSQPELALGLGLVSQDPFTSVTRQSKNIVQVNPSSSLESLKAGVVPENKETLDEFAIRKQISEVLRLVSFARGSQLDRGGDPMSSNKKPVQAHGYPQSQTTGSIPGRYP